MPSKNQAGCTCCGGENCLIFADTFDGSDSSSLAGWYEAVGDWERVSNRLVPEASVADQRILAETGGVNLTPSGVTATVTFRGDTGDRAGLGIFMASNPGDTAADAYADGNWIEATVRFGSGTSGRLNLNVYLSGSLEITWNADLECSANEYDIPPNEDVTLTLCVQYQGLTSTAVATLVVGAETIEIGVNGLMGTIPGGASSLRYAACITGADSTAVSFNDFSFYHVTDDCEDCLECGWDEWFNGEATPLANFTEVAGDWIASPTPCFLDDGVDTEDVDALLIYNERWANDNLFIWVRICQDGERPFKARLIFSYVDDDNYWCVEVSITALDDDPSSTISLVEMDLIHRDGGVETVESSWPFGPAYWGSNVWIDIQVYVWDCLVAFGSGTLMSCYADAALNDTGRFGVGTGDTVTELVRFSAMQVRCATEFECTDAPPTDPPDYPPPGDPFDSCCPDLADIEVDDTFEFHLGAFDIESGEPCESLPCYSDITTVFLGLANIHTVTCVYRSPTLVVLHGDTGVVVTCSGDDETAKIWVWISKTGADQCTIRAALFIATCHVLWQRVITDEESCLDLDIPYVGRPGIATCCLNFASSAARISLP